MRPKYSLDALRRLAAQHGFADPNIAAAIAMAESGGLVAARGDNGSSHGLWQINSPSHPQYDPAKLEADEHYNAQAAYDISKGGTDWSPWSTYKNNAYWAYMP